MREKKLINLGELSKTETSVLENLNNRHFENLSKLKEVNIRLNNAVLYLGGTFPRSESERKSDEPVCVEHHTYKYNDLINYATDILEQIFEEIERLEYLVGKKS
jgi:hypothetical protein